MKTISKKQIEKYWEDGEYLKIQPFNIDDFCLMWVKEEGIMLPENFSVTANNSDFFTRMNGQKHAINLILAKFRYNIIATESLPLSLEPAVMRATELVRENGGKGVIRGGHDMAAGGGTFVIEHERSIPMMISTLLHNPKGQITPLFSKYYYAQVEYGVFIIDGKVELVIGKERNPITGLHNLSLGAKAHVVEDEAKISSIKNMCEGLSELFYFGFARIDIMDTTEGLKIVELSVPNFKKFAIQDEFSYQQAKKLFIKYYNAFYA